MNDIRTHLPPRAASQEKPTLTPALWGQQVRPSPGEEAAKFANGLEASRSLSTKGSKEADDRRAGNGRRWGWGGAHSPLPRLGWKIHRKRTQMDRPWGVGEDRMRAEGLSHFLCAKDGPEGLPLPLAPPPTQGPPFCPRPPASSPGPQHPEGTRKMFVDSQYS